MDFDAAPDVSSSAADHVQQAWHLAGAESDLDVAMMMAAGPGDRPGRDGP